MSAMRITGAEAKVLEKKGAKIKRQLKGSAIKETSEPAQQRHQLDAILISFGEEVRKILQAAADTTDAARKAQEGVVSAQGSSARLMEALQLAIKELSKEREPRPFRFVINRVNGPYSPMESVDARPVSKKS